MQVISRKDARVTGLAILLAAGFFLLPVTASHVDRIGYASAWAGDHGGDHGGGIKDQMPASPGNNGYTSYSPDAPQTVVPCQSCRMGATGSGYEPQYVAPCHANWCGGE